MARRKKHKDFAMQPFRLSALLRGVNVSPEQQGGLCLGRGCTVQLDPTSGALLFLEIVLLYACFGEEPWVSLDKSTSHA